MTSSLLRSGRIRLLVAVGLAVMLVAAGCQPLTGPPAPDSPDPGGDDAPDEAETDVDYETISPEDDPPEAVTEWMQSHRGDIGVYQKAVEGETYVLVSWGEKSTGGYAVEVTDASLEGDDELHLDISLLTPDEDGAVTQAITYPQTLIRVEPTQQYTIRPSFEGARFYENRSFRIDSPEMNTAVTDQVHVAGEARVFEASFLVSIEDGHNVLAEEVVTADEGAPSWGDFSVDVSLEETPTSPNGVVRIYYESPKDGSPTDEIFIPVTFPDFE